MRYIRNERIFEDAEWILRELCHVSAGESLVFLVDDACSAYGDVFCRKALDMGANGILIDLEHFRDGRGFMPVPRMEPLRSAILHADASFLLINQKQTNFGRILGNRDETDQSLLKSSRRYTMEANGMERWNLDRERVLTDRRRTEALYERLKRADQIRVTSARGTDITCKVGGAPDGMYPVMGIMPFYGEVAIVPAMGTVNGVFVADGASEFAEHHRGFPIRPSFPGNSEIWREPLRMVYENSVLVSYSGDPEQTGRLDRLMAKVEPKPDLCDEIGLVTCTSPENDRFGWLVDGSHQTHCVHVAIGNNRRRGEIIHSTEHVDFDMHEPTVYVDGRVIYQNGVFDDAWIMRD